VYRFPPSKIGNSNCRQSGILIVANQIGIGSWAVSTNFKSEAGEVPKWEGDKYETILTVVKKLHVGVRKSHCAYSCAGQWLQRQHRPDRPRRPAGTAGTYDKEIRLSFSGFKGVSSSDTAWASDFLQYSIYRFNKNSCVGADSIISVALLETTDTTVQCSVRLFNQTDNVVSRDRPLQQTRAHSSLRRQTMSLLCCHTKI